MKKKDPVLRRPNHEIINYGLRPAKAVERKMLCEALSRLSLLNSLKNYAYIGFGSTYFTDFLIFHRSLGITDLLSIEGNVEYKDRFLFNVPFSCIKMEFGHSNSIIPGLSWEKPTILWLDYIGKLEENMFSDLEAFFFKAKPGSMFLMTVNVKPDNPKEFSNEQEDESIAQTKSVKEFRYKQLSKRVGIKNVPNGIEDINLGKVENPSVIYQIICNKIQGTIKDRNGILEKDKKIIYKQLFHFLYNDGTPMLTVGGLIFEASQTQFVEKMRFEELDFIKPDKVPFVIIVPNLTYREIHALDSFLPGNVNKTTGTIIKNPERNMSEPFVSNEDVINYLTIYRYYPTFAEAIF